MGDIMIKKNLIGLLLLVAPAYAMEQAIGPNMRNKMSKSRTYLETLPRDVRKLVFTYKDYEECRKCTGLLGAKKIAEKISTRELSNFRMHYPDATAQQKEEFSNSLRMYLYALLSRPIEGWGFRLFGCFIKNSVRG